MPEPDPIPTRLPRRSSELNRLREAIAAAALAGRAACDDNPGLAAEVAPLLARLDEIREEIDRHALFPSTPLGGELYPFWARLARSGRG